MSGEDDGFTSKNWVWVPDDTFFSKGYVTDYLADGKTKVTVVEGNQEITKIVDNAKLENCNPQKFNKCDDMAELTHLNEPSVVYNLYLRYNDDMIYTYSGLFLVAINPYKKLNIYDSSSLRKFHNHRSSDGKPPPHIFSTAEKSYRNLLENKKDQSILVTGESGAGKTENTKKIIQYLSSITSHGTTTPPPSSADSELVDNSIEAKILQANPILESFGNAKTIKNNNSSRFGKFIKIYVSSSGSISGANIEYYLLEKSRVVHQVSDERNYHVFYQLLKGSTKEELTKYSLKPNVKSYNYLKNSLAEIPKTDDSKEFKFLVEAFKIIGFSEDDTNHIFLILAAILHLGNLEFTSTKAEQASFTSDSPSGIISSLLGVPKKDLVENLLKPKVKAGREFVTKTRNAAAVQYAVDAFAKYLYEKIFQFIIKRVNENLEDTESDYDGNFIGVLDIAGFEIFEQNSFEQLCINYTNEKLQQFFNHHSFILEQSEYLREDIQWEFIDFGLDLQPTIDLIETKKPMGILSILDEECMVPKSSDKIFMDKLAFHWGNGENKKFKQNKYKSGFIINHYAGVVEYNVENWLQKNTDPVTDSLLKLLPNSTNEFIKELFENDEHINVKPGSGRLRTASQKHKEQLSNLMAQLGKTEPHFVRCILPNLEKKPNKFDKQLVLHQLRCNGVLEGIRIARAGYPNKMTFEEFFQRYSILDVKEVFTKTMKTNCELIIKHINLNIDSYKVGITKIFFKNGILGKLEELRDLCLKLIFTQFQSMIRGRSTRKHIKKKIEQIQASQLFARNLKTLDESLKGNLWLDLFLKIKPLLEDSVKVLDNKEMNENLKKVKDKLKDTEIIKEKLENENVQLKDQMKKLEDDIISTNQIINQRDSIVEQMKSEAKERKTKIDFLSAEIKSYQKEIEAHKETKNALELKLANHKKDLEQNVNSLNKAKEEHLTIQKQYEKLNKTLKTHEENADKHRELIEQLQDGASNHKVVIAKMADEHELKLNEKIAELEELNVQISKMKEEFFDAKSKLESTIQDSELKIESLEIQIQENSDSSKTFKGKFDNLAKENKSIEEKHSKVHSLHELLSSKHNDLTKEHKTLSDSHKKLLKEHKSLTEDHAQVNERLESRTKSHTSQISELQVSIKQLKKDLSSTGDQVSQKESLISSLKQKLEYHEQEVTKTKSLKSSVEKEIAEFKKRILELKSENNSLTSKYNDLQSEHSKLKLELQDQQNSQKELKETQSKNIKKLEELENLKDELSSMTTENSTLRITYQKIKVELEASKKSQEDYSRQILDLRGQVREFEEKESKGNKENVPPMNDPSFVEDFANVKLKLNEQSATLRREKFENQKLSEELKQLKKRMSQSFAEYAESPHRKLQATTPNFRRSLAIGDESSTDYNYNRNDEIESLKLRLQQEESNVQRAETYAIDLQKKLNKLQTSRGISNPLSLESDKKFREAQERIQELESKIEEILKIDESPKRLAKSESFGRSALINKTLNNSNLDFVKIYQDITKTLKVTRDELQQSKSEILRLKHLLRELEDELYESKKASFRSSVTDYENQLAQLKVRQESVISQNLELSSNIDIYRKRADEYYKKLELAESAVKISKRHEEAATKELEYTKTQLQLARDESRASQLLIKEVRQENTKLESKIKDKDYEIKQLQYQIKNLSDKIDYFTKNYENVENQQKLKDEIRDLRRDLAFKLETETSLIRDNKKFSLDLEELTQEKQLLDKDFEVQSIRLEELEGLYDESSNRARSLENEKQLNERKINNFSKQVGGLKELVQQLNEQKELLLNEKDKLEEDLLKLSHVQEETVSKLTQTEADMSIMRDHLENQRQQSDDLQSEFRQSKLSNNHDIVDYGKLKKEILVTNEENDSLKKNNTELTKKVQMLEDKLYGNEQLKYWEKKVDGLIGDLDESQGETHEANKKIQLLEREVKKLEIRVTNESQLSKKYNDENFDYQNKVNHYKSTVDILHSENLDKSLRLKQLERENDDMKGNMLTLEKEVLELRARLGI